MPPRRCTCRAGDEHMPPTVPERADAMAGADVRLARRLCPAAGKGGCESCRGQGCASCDASSARCTDCYMRTGAYEGSTSYFYYWQLDPVAKKCVRIFREKNTIPPNEYY